MNLAVGADAVRRAADDLRVRIADRRPQIGLVLGSGLGAVAEQIERPIQVPYAQIAGFTPSAILGHPGRLTVGTLCGCEVIALAGRVHAYEGHGPATVVLPVRVLHALGVHTLLVSNAAGGIRHTLRRGDLMLMRDHINLMWLNPLIGPACAGEARFPDMSDPYDWELLGLLREAALNACIRVVEGVYAAVSGPSYESPAEIRMLERLGADAVGMSTVPEVLVARALGLRVAGVSCVTNAASGTVAGKLSHAEVLEVATQASARFGALVRGFLRLLAG